MVVADVGDIWEPGLKMENQLSKSGNTQGHVQVKCLWEEGEG